MANHYLLLRRNQQTGPYTIDELQKLPLEPYDLVWIDGVSDTWKYPGEIDELKSFAPYTGNLRYNFNVRKPGSTDVRPTQPAVQLPTDSKYLPEENPVTDMPQHQDARNTAGNDARFLPVTPISNIGSTPSRIQTRNSANNRRDLKKTSLWAVPIFLLFLLGIWIGTNWNKFPANEGVSVPLTNNNARGKNGAATYEERKNGLTTPDNAASSIIVPQEPAIDESLNEVNADETIAAGSPDSDQEGAQDEVSNNASEEIEVEKPIQKTDDKKVTTPAAPAKRVIVPKIVPEREVAREAKPVSSSSDRASASGTTKKVASPNKVATKKTTDIVYSDRNVPVVSKTRGAANTNQTGMTRRQQPVSANSQVSVKNQPVPDSYMSKKLVPVDHLVDVDGNYKKNEDGKGVKEVDFTVYNRSGKYLKAVKLEIQYFGKNNTLLKKQDMKFYNISSDGAVKLDAAAHNNAERIGYKVLYISSTIGDFYYEPMEFLSSASR